MARGGGNMGNPGPSAEEILRHYFEPALKAAEEAMEVAQISAPEDPSLAIGIVSVRLLRAFLEKTIERITAQETAERVAVYHVVTRECAKFLGLPAEMLFPAVLKACGEQDEGLIGSFAAPGPGALQALNAALLRVTVTYHPQVGVGADRVIHLFILDASKRQVQEIESKAALKWEGVPEDVREQAIRFGERTVSFTLYAGNNELWTQ
jgi:hypothetical protein